MDTTTQQAVYESNHTATVAVADGPYVNVSYLVTDDGMLRAEGDETAPKWGQTVECW